MEKQEALFNSGLAKLERIHKLKIGCHKSRFEDNYVLWLKALRGLHTEVIERMTKEDHLKALNYELKIKQAMTPTQEVNLYYGEITKTGNFEDLLYEYEFFMSNLIERYGMGMPNKPSISNAISQME